MQSRPSPPCPWPGSQAAASTDMKRMWLSHLPSELFARVGRDVLEASVACLQPGASERDLSALILQSGVAKETVVMFHL